MMFTNIVWHLLAGTRGGGTRTRILVALKRRPANPHRLAKRLDLDYKTVQHHLRLLEKHGLVQWLDGYGGSCFVSESLKASWSDFQDIWNSMGKDLGKPS